MTVSPTARFDPSNSRTPGTESPQYCRVVSECPVSATASDGVEEAQGHCRIWNPRATSEAQAASSTCTSTACQPANACQACSSACSAVTAPAADPVGYEWVMCAGENVFGVAGIAPVLATAARTVCPTETAQCSTTYCHCDLRTTHKTKARIPRMPMRCLDPLCHGDGVASSLTTFCAVCSLPRPPSGVALQKLFRDLVVCAVPRPSSPAPKLPACEWGGPLSDVAAMVVYSCTLLTYKEDLNCNCKLITVRCVFQVTSMNAAGESCFFCTAQTDSCLSARNGACDVPILCSPGTDCTDCKSCGAPGHASASIPADPPPPPPPPGAAGSNDSCRYANDAVCDVPTYCTAGTDCTDCQNCQSSSSSSSAGNPACWSGAYTAARCCDASLGASGDRTCWSGQFNFVFCCAMVPGGH